MNGIEAAPGSDRDAFIPVRKADLIAALAAEDALPAVGRADFLTLCRLLGAIYHYSYFDRLEELRHAYFYFNPEFEPHGRLDAAELDRNYSELAQALDDVLKHADFVEVPHEEIERAHRDHVLARVTLRADTEDFRQVRFFRRGHRRETAEMTDWFGLRRRRIEIDVYDDVVLFVALKDEDEIASPRARKRLAQSKIRCGSVLIKYFRNVASADLHALFPNVRVVMSSQDKLMLGVPALIGGIPIILNLIASMSVLFLVIGFYLGLVGFVEQDHFKKAFAAISGFGALGAFMLQQWVKYQRQSLAHQKQLTDNVYFRNINNNAGIFDYLIGVAEEQECKEAILAYHFLHTAKAPPAQDQLDETIEAWLHDRFHVDVDFDVSDALGKLDRAGLLMRDGDKLRVPPLGEALARLDRLWDGFFDYSGRKAS